MTIKYLAGVDEVGRGCLAGPVISAAVILKKSAKKDLLKDSKTLSPSKRIYLAQYIVKASYSIGIGIATNEEIDDLNIHNASLLSMERAINNLNIEPDLIYVDGLFKPPTKYKTQCFIKGDSLKPSISAASIIAKVVRDNEMMYLNSLINVYQFNEHKGYPTKSHKLALNTFGPSIYHRKSFRPVKDLIGI